MTAVGADADKSCRLGSDPRSRQSRLAPVEEQLTLGEVPATVNFDERVKVPERGDHDLAVACFGEEVVGDRVALAGGAVAVDRDRALAVSNRAAGWSDEDVRREPRAGAHGRGRPAGCS